MEVIAINLNEFINIILDKSGLEIIHLSIILEYVGEEFDVLEAIVSHSWPHIKQNNIHHH
jgi:hypothetical protein